MVVAGLIMLFYQRFVQQKPLAVPKSLIPKLLLLALFNIYLTNALELWGLQYLTSSKTCLLYSSSPFLSALFCYSLFAEKLTLKKWAGLAIGFIGLFPVLFDQSGQETEIVTLFSLSWAEFSVLAAVIASVYGWILLRQLIESNRITTFAANGFSMLLGGVIALVHSSLTEEWDPLPVKDWTIFLECTLLLIVISNITCYNLYGYLLKKYTPTFLSFAGFTTPIFAALFGWLFLNETIEMSFYLSSGAILIGLILFNQDELQQMGYIKKEKIA